VSTTLELLADGIAYYYDTEMLAVAWETNPKVVDSLLPAPLKPYKRPIAMAFIANCPNTSFGVSYRFGALALMCEYEGEPGTYFLSMPEDDDIPVFLGREVLGYPKKMAKLSMKRGGQRFEGWIERRGIRIFEVQATLDGTPNAQDAVDILDEIYHIFPDVSEEQIQYKGITFLLKHFLAPEGGFDYTPRLIRQETIFRPYQLEVGHAKVTLRESPYDSPWSRVEVVRLLGALYTRGNNTMHPGRVIAEVNPEEVEPFAGLKYDW
jgi:acetoacetate decarboxylase